MVSFNSCIGRRTWTYFCWRRWRRPLFAILIPSLLTLAIWFVVTFVVGYYARELNFNFFGWPFSVWVAGQGALIVYCVIIWYYAHYMNKLDIEHNVHEED